MEPFNRMDGSHRAGPWSSPDQASWTTLALGPGSDEPAPAVRAARTALTTPAKRLPQASTGTPGIPPSKPKGPPGSAGRSGLRLRPEATLELPDQALEFADALAEGRILGVEPGELGGGLRARACRQRAIRHRGEQTRCARRPARGWPHTSHSRGVRTAPGARRQTWGQAGEPRRGRRGPWRAGSRSTKGSGYATRARVRSGMQRRSFVRRRSIRCGVTRSPRQTRSADDDASHEPDGGADALRLSLLCLYYIARHKLALRGTAGHA
jgi:hypothetical protein